ncbi:low specificity L-threonine aldolase [Persicobacter sp. CCB-QB2]|uniref:threonine aldolase family protein n=1 Tax=Persicobacter sp. CCB-QB2 TaxID=1561025 RepID=UPI0006A973C5|nr:GntG family PLP-dependent aldolase [Persicobacter sp. CCB-QB2]
MKIDLRSDTVTRPTPEMLDALWAAQVGDDLFDEDPTVHALEEKIAQMFGKEEAMFCPSGTMTNQIAIKLHTQMGDEVICDELSHIYHYETGGMAFNSGVQASLIKGDHGRITAAQVEEKIRPDAFYMPKSTLVSLENTCNKGGGAYYHLEEIKKIRSVCKQHELPLHLDGARLFNALVETGESPLAYGEQFDTISICLSKGLGAPIGSVLLGTKEHMAKALRIRKVLGGAMRQSGYLAAAAIYALDHHIAKLKEDHKRTRILAEALAPLPFVDRVIAPSTNILIFDIRQDLDAMAFLNVLAEKDIYAVPFGGQSIRFVTHYDFTDQHLEETISRLKKIDL